ncbi:MAG: hypothetical protein PBV01_10440 [Brucella anthropi]|jgi:hypothetical protein
MQAISDFFGYSIPWWALAFPAGAAVLTTFIAVSRVFGFRNALAAAVAVGSVALVALSYRKGKQDGWQDRIRKEQDDAKALSDKARAARNGALAADPRRLRDDDGFKRRD